MFGKKNRQIRDLHRRLDKAVEQRDEATRERDAAVRLNARLAQKASQATEHANRASRAWGVVVKDANLAESLFQRAMRIRRLESRRLRRTIAEQRVALRKERERSASLDRQLTTLQVANMAADWQRTPLKAAS